MSSSDDICARLGAWPRTLHGDLASLMRESLPACSALFGARTVVAVWEERDEAALTIATWDRDGFRWRELEDGAEYRPIVNRELAEPFAGDADSLHPRIRDEYALDRVVAIPLAGTLVDGWLFASEPTEEPEAMRTAASAVAALMSFRIDAVVHLQNARSATVAEERSRIARDLHDGLLQSFTGAVLQIETAHALLHDDPGAAARLLTQVQAGMMADQRELRAFVESLRRRRRTEHHFDFAGQLLEMSERFEQQWGVGVAVDTAGVAPAVGDALGQETFRLVQEAVTNSARHGAASRVAVRIRTTEHALLIDVSDNGSGLPTRGRLTMHDMRERAVGPVSLADRVAALNGQIVADSSEQGLRLEITLPLGWAGA